MLTYVGEYGLLPQSVGLIFPLLSPLFLVPCSQKIFFAGEGTCREHPATAAGAYLTGAQSTCFTSTKVRIVTAEELAGLREAARVHALFTSPASGH
jgi:hypothetical protein